MSSRKELHVPAADFQIGEWLARPSLNLLRCSSTERHLEPQVMDLLAFLATTSGRVVSKDEIIAAVWEGRIIADTTLTRSIADLRRALGDDQRSPAYIETIAKRGYRLVATVSFERAHEPAAVGTRQADVPGAERISDRLASARQRRFIGRTAEIDQFRSALAVSASPFVVWHITGPGGIGKTTLLQELAHVAREADRSVMSVDGRNIEPTAAGFLAALGRKAGINGVGLADVIAQWPAGAVLFVDTYELLEPLDEWLRRTLLPQLPGHSLAVVAGRNQPATAWRTDVEWAALTRITPLRNLDVGESRTYLSRCGVPAEHHEEALAFTRGHPLALSLIADVMTRGDRLTAANLHSEPEVVRTLLEAFVQDVPSRDHRLALHACVTAWATTERLLAAALDRPDAHDLFEWLEHLPFVEHGPYGLFPHDLARDVVYMNFYWRDPDAAARITERTLGYLYQRLEHSQGLDRQRIWFDVIYVQRYNPCMRPYYEWGGFGTAYAETANPCDHEALLALVERHEGPASASIARYWLERQPEAFLAIRSVAGALMGFLGCLCLDGATPEDRAADPAIAQAMAFAERDGPLRSGERIVYGRFWMDAERHQAMTQAFTVVSAAWLQRSIAPQTAWSFVAMREPDQLDPMFTDLHVWRTREADFEVDGTRYGVFAHDWRVETQQEWLRHKAQRAARLDRQID